MNEGADISGGRNVVDVHHISKTFEGREASLRVMSGDLLAAGIEFARVPDVGECRPSSAERQELPQHQRVVVVGGAVVGDDQVCAHMEPNPVARARGRHWPFGRG